MEEVAALVEPVVVAVAVVEVEALVEPVVVAVVVEVVVEEEVVALVEPVVVEAAVVVEAVGAAEEPLGLVRSEPVRSARSFR